MSRNLIDEVRDFERPKAGPDLDGTPSFGHRVAAVGFSHPTPGMATDIPSFMATSDDPALDPAEELAEAVAIAPRTLRRAVDGPVSDDDADHWQPDTAAPPFASRQPQSHPDLNQDSFRQLQDRIQDRAHRPLLGANLGAPAQQPESPMVPTTGRAHLVMVTAADLETLAETAQIGLTLARKLALGGRALVLTLDGCANQYPLGLADLLRGTASFPQVIYRDGNSRLHRIDQGVGDIFLTEAFQFVMDALVQTYDYIVILAGAVEAPASDGLARYADTAVLAARPELSQSRLHMLTDRLQTAGVQEVTPTMIVSQTVDRSAA